MNRWKQHLIDGYCWATWPWRSVLVQQLQRRGRAPVLILFYHRIADSHPNAWTLSWEAFQRQVRWIRDRFALVSLADAQRRIREGRNERPVVSLTFDDGYAENCERALPWLLSEGIPFSYFVTWENVRYGQAFPHDQEAGQPLPPNTLTQLRELAAAGAEIGCHTRTHPDLGSLADEARLYDEVVTVREELQAAIQKPVRYFAFPYGLMANLNARVFALAREAGYAGVCSAYGGYNFPGDDAFHLQRIHADAEFARFRNWLTLDPRKVRMQRYSPENSADTSSTRQDHESAD